MEVVRIRDTEEFNLQIVNAKPTKDATATSQVREPSARYGSEALPSLRHETKDVLKQLQANINYLEDLGGRLGFVLGEVRGLIRR